MAVGKEAPISNICVSSAACRASLEAVVAKFSEVMEDTPMTTVRRRLKDADIDLEMLKPVVISGFSNESPRAADVLDCSPTKTKLA
jgi:hypothetical protein